MKNSKKILQPSVNKNSAIINNCAKLNGKRYRKEHRGSRRISYKSGNQFPTNSNLTKIKHLTKYIKSLNAHIQDSELEMSLKAEHPLPDLPSKIFFAFTVNDLP